jgi:hypothetical protein
MFSILPKHIDCKLMSQKRIEIAGAASRANPQAIIEDLDLRELMGC